VRTGWDFAARFSGPAAVVALAGLMILMLHLALPRRFRGMRTGTSSGCR
jgi:hypothetical protein